MLSSNRSYSVFAAMSSTRTIHHAHIEAHSRISPTEPTVTKTVQPKLPIRSVLSMPRAQFSNPTNACPTGIEK